MTAHRAARWVANASLVLASCAVTLLVCEVAVRILRPQPMAAVVPSARLGWLNKPNSELLFERREFRNRVRFSSAGLHDREYPLHKPPGRLRIAWLGDSFVEALQVPLDSCAAKRLESTLAQRVPRHCEVLNFGVSGYGGCQQMLLLEEMALRFEPDLVLTQYYANDLDDDARFGACTLDGGGRLIVASSARLSARARLRGAAKAVLFRHSHLWMFLSTRKRRTAHPTASAPAEDAVAAGADAALPVHDEAGGAPVPSCPGRHKTHEWGMTLRELPPATARALDLQAAMWARMSEACRARGARLVVVLGVSRPQIEPAAYARTLRDTGCSAAAHDVDLPSARLAAAAAVHGVAVVDLLGAFRRGLAAGDTLHFRFDGHWNAAGHRVAAAALCDSLLGRGILGTVQP